VEAIKKKLKDFDGVTTDSRGRSRVVPLLWHEGLDVQLLSMSLHHIDVAIRGLGVSKERRFISLYGWLEHQHKTLIGNLIGQASKYSLFFSKRTSPLVVFTISATVAMISCGRIVGTMTNLWKIYWTYIAPPPNGPFYSPGQEIFTLMLSYPIISRSSSSSRVMEAGLGRQTCI